MRSNVLPEAGHSVAADDQTREQAEGMERPLFSKILLAVDSTHSSRAAAVAIAHLAAPLKSQVLVLHVWNLETRVREGSWDIETLPEARKLVDGVVERLREAGVDASGQLVNAATNKVGPAIEESAAAFGADLVAVGSRGLSDLAGVFAGSVSHRLLADLDCPVLIAAEAPARTERLRRILLAISYEAESGPLGDLAAGIAKPVDATVLVFHVQTRATAAEGYVYIEPPAEAQAVVDQAVARIRASGVKAEGRVGMAVLPVADEIAAVAQTWDAHLIISGSRRHRDLAALIVGSTDHELIRQAHRPVLIAPRPKE
jgi:nucleotide-binding universal stress UspA family protein